MSLERSSQRSIPSTGYYKEIYHPQPSPRLSEHRLKKLVKIFCKLNSGTLLDIGCSDGGIGSIISRAMGATEVFGLDLSREALATARGLGFNVVQCDFEKANLPLRDESFDAIYAGEVVEHLFNPSHMLEEIMRVLKPGGKCVLTTPNLASWINRLLLLIGYQPFLTNADFRFGNIGKVRKLRMPNEAGEHIRPFTHRAFKELIVLHGFKIETVAGASMGLAETSSFLARLINRIDRFLCSRSAWSTIQIVCFSKERIRCPSLGTDRDADTLC